jgi:hypothetical protein
MSKVDGRTGPNDQELYEAYLDLPLVSGPSIVMRDSDTGRRTRPAARRLADIPRSARTAEIICHRTGHHQPAQVGLVIGPRDAGHVLLSEPTAGGPIGQDILAPCRCGLDHVIDGGKLRSALLALRAKKGWAPRIDVATIERSNDGADGLR